MTPTLVEEVRHFRWTLAAVGGWMFPAEQDPRIAADRYAFDTWLRKAEAKAELPKLVGGLWHAYRRKWATERKALPLPDVAEAGGMERRDDAVDVLSALDERRAPRSHDGGAEGARCGRRWSRGRAVADRETGQETGQPRAANSVTRCNISRGDWI